MGGGAQPTAHSPSATELTSSGRLFPLAAHMSRPRETGDRGRPGDATRPEKMALWPTADDQS